MSRWMLAATGLFLFAAVVLWRSLPHTPEPEKVPLATAGTTLADEAAADPVVKQLPPPAVSDESLIDNEVITLTDEVSAKAMLFTLMMRLEQPMREWASSRGLPLTDANGNFMLDQPYQQYDEATLLALANNGDMWAQQILAERIAFTRPAEAMELYRKAAAQGSIFAMLQLAELAESVSRMPADFGLMGENDDRFALDQYYALRDGPVSLEVTAYAWKAVAEMAGLPGFLAITSTGMPDDSGNEACELAAEIYSDLLTRRQNMGLGAYPRDTPPAWIDLAAADVGRGCEHEQAVQYDFSGCKQIRVEAENDNEEGEPGIYVCADG